MANKAIHQLPAVSDVEQEDLFHVVRDPGYGYTDYKLQAAFLLPAYYTASVFIESAAVLTLYDTPVTILAAQGEGTVIVPRFATVQYSNGTTNYVTAGGVAIRPIGASSGYLVSGAMTGGDTVSVWSEANGTGGSPEDTGCEVFAPGSNPTTGDYDVTITMYYHLLATLD